MTRPPYLPAMVVALWGCDDTFGPDPGTFVGNPSMETRLADNAVQRAQGGALEAFEVNLTDCRSPTADIHLGPRTLTFVGARSEEIIRLEPGRHCGLFLVVYRFEVRFDEADGGEVTTVIADNFDLAVPAGLFAERGGRYRLRLGDEDWLRDVAALAPAGETTVLNGQDPALDRAFYDGLTRGSTIEVLGN